MRLPQAALKFRSDSGLAGAKDLQRLNITAWLYRDKQGVEGIKVNPNTTIAELLAQFGPADTRDAEVGIHSEGRAAEFFRTHPELTVLQIFTERIPCAKMCAPLLRHYFPGVPVLYYYNRNAWNGTKSAADILAGIYGSSDAQATGLAQLKDQFARLRSLASLRKGEHLTQLNNIRHSWNPMGRAVQVFNPVATPELSIWDEVESSLNIARTLLDTNNVPKAGAFLMAARLQYLVALRQFIAWKDGFDAGAQRTYVAIGAISVSIIFAAASAFALGASATAADGAVATADTGQTLVRIQLLSQRAETFIRIASSEGEPEQLIEEILREASAMP